MAHKTGKKNTPALFIAIIISLFLHLSVAVFHFGRANTFKQPPLLSSSISVTLKATPQTEQTIIQDPEKNEHLRETKERPGSETKPSAATPKKLSHSDNKNLKIKKEKPEEAVSGSTIYNRLSDYAAQLEYKETSADDFQLFDQQQIEKLNRAQQKKEQSAQLEESQRRQRLHQYHEFQSVGNQKIVRIDGSCASVPEDDPLDEFDNPIMLNMGECSAKKKIKFKSYAPHILAKEKTNQKSEVY